METASPDRACARASVALPKRAKFSRSAGSRNPTWLEPFQSRWRRQTRRVAGSNGTFTTARSRGWSISGLVGLADRVEALGGTVEVRSQPGKGTHITAELLLDTDYATASLRRGNTQSARGKWHV